MNMERLENKTTATKSAEMTAAAAKNELAVVPMEANGKAAETDAGIYTHTFKVPFVYGGATYQELTFNFERLTGRDMVAIETEMQMNGEYALAPEVSRCFQAKMAARAAGIGSDILDAMPLKDFNRITNAARSFLLDTGY